MIFSKTVMPLLLVFALTPDSASADGGILQTLPKDGTWVRYFVEVKVDQLMKVTGSLTLRSVGIETVSGEEYRWFEVETQLKPNGIRARTVMKVLVRKKDVNKGAKSGLTIARGWTLSATGQKKERISALSDLEKSPKGPLGLFFCCTFKKAKTVKRSRTIDYQKGRLQIATAQTGDLNIQMQENSSKDGKIFVKQTIWKHKSIPIGSAMVEIEVRQDGKIVEHILLTVQDFGKNAKSALPDKK